MNRKADRSDTDINMATIVGGVQWKNPVTTASGTFSWDESNDFYDFTKLGAVTTKGVSYEPWSGNPTPRIAETPSGMLNSVGLENPGVKMYIKNDIPRIKEIIKDSDCKIVTNVAGHSKQEYIKAVEYLNKSDAISMLEINISCPNLQCGGMSFGTDPEIAYDLIKSLKNMADKPLIVKLTPNVTDIVSVAKAVESAGADALSLINTLSGMRIDINTGKPILKNITGGLSGPAIKPVAIRMVYDVSRSTDIPVIGMGGISSGKDAAEFIMAGANAVAVGTAALVDPTAPIRILEELKQFMENKKIYDLTGLRNFGRNKND